MHQICTTYNQLRLKYRYHTQIWFPGWQLNFSVFLIQTLLAEYPSRSALSGLSKNKFFKNIQSKSGDLCGLRVVLTEAIFLEINVGNNRIRHKTTHKLNNEFLDWLKIDGWLKFRVVLCRIRFFPTLILWIKWLESEQSLTEVLERLNGWSLEVNFLLKYTVYESIRSAIQNCRKVESSYSTVYFFQHFPLLKCPVHASIWLSNLTI